MKNIKSTIAYFVTLSCIMLILCGCGTGAKNDLYKQDTTNKTHATEEIKEETLGIIFEPKGAQEPKQKPTPTPKPTQKAVVDKDMATTKPQKEENDVVVFDKGTQTQNQPILEEDEKFYCSIVVSCQTILDNIDKLKEEKHRLVPSDGIILSKEKIEFNEGESAFNVLQRELKREKIHMEFVNTPMYDSVYIEGINNLYEFDCGSESGWTYSVNDWIPNYGISQHILKNGDRIVVYYICDRSEDIF